MLCAMHARLRTRALWCAGALALLLWLALLCAAVLLLPVAVRHAAVAGIGAYCLHTVARCTAHGRTGTVAVPRLDMIWLLAVGALSPLDVLVYSCGWPVETIYWLVKLHALPALMVALALREDDELCDAIGASEAAAGVRLRLGTVPPRLEIDASGSGDNLPAVRRLLAAQAHRLRGRVDEVRMRLAWGDAPPAGLVWSGLTACHIDGFKMGAGAMAALVGATPHLRELQMTNGRAQEPAAELSLHDGWIRLQKVYLGCCDAPLYNWTIWQTREVKKAIFFASGPPPPLGEFARRNAGTLAHMDAHEFAMDELEQLAQCARLRYLGVHTDFIGPWQWDGHTCARFAALVQRLASLRTLRVHTGDLPEHLALPPGSMRHLDALLVTADTVPPRAVHDLLMAAPSVTCLQLDNRDEIDEMDEATVQHVVDTMPRLRKLRLGRIAALSDHLLHRLAAALPHLTHLWLRYERIAVVEPGPRGDADQWATLAASPHALYTRLKLIYLEDVIDDDASGEEVFYRPEEEVESAVRLRAALAAMLGRMHGVYNAAVGRLNGERVDHAGGGGGRCALGAVMDWESDDDAMLPSRQWVDWRRAYYVICGRDWDE